MSIAVIGVDAGGTKTTGVLVGLDGSVLAERGGGPANYQSVGLRRTRESLSQVLTSLVDSARERGLSVGRIGLALAGLDRPRDELLLADMVSELGDTQIPRLLFNDGYAILRAGSRTGVGLAVVSGTGCNVVGVDGQGTRHRIGGLCFEMGDFGSAEDIGVAALRNAVRGDDGRGPVTELSHAVREHMAVSSLDDLVDRLCVDSATPIPFGELAPVVFDVADRGDAVALGILERAGRELGRSVALLASRMQPSGAPPNFDLVLGGGVLQHGRIPAMRDALIEVVKEPWPEVRPIILKGPPAAGAALIALDHLGRDGVGDPQRAFDALSGASS